MNPPPTYHERSSPQQSQMTAEADREVRRFMKKNRIFVKPYSENAGYAAAHEEIFGDILALGRYRLSSYTASIDIRLKDEPWRKHTKSRAQWLSRRALTLKEQQRNEAGWRYHLENHVLHRLLVEVACSKCRSRLWRSEIEPSIKGDVLLEEDLTKRRKAREPCSCPPDDRQWDIYETGLKNLFEDRIEDTVLAEASTESLLSDKTSDRRRRPDRIFGLRETNNFEKLLDKVPSQRIGNPGTIRHSMRITPFKDTEDPLLFPFLVIEAKSGESRDGFSDIEFQSAIPVKALLQLQSQLRGRVSSIKTADPLVWFLGYRGDSWRVYACYMSSDNPPACEIVFLWNGSLLLQDEALQLILILDYIVDWARDIYRPSVLRQLKSITSGKAFDEVSLVSDSDVLSIRRSVSRWPAPAPSIFDRLMSAIEPEVKFNVPPVMNAIPLSSPIIRSPRGVVRYLQQITKKMTGLCIWEANVQDFFNVINGGLKESAKSQTVAREIVNSFSLEERQKSGRKTEGPSDTTRQRNLQERTLCLTGSEIQALEESWMAETRHTDDFSDIPPQERFFCFISFECCLTTSWDVVKQITFLAVTKSALDIIVENARYKRSAPTLPAFLASWDKSFEDQALQDCIHCLSSSSPSQALLAAIHARSLTICGRARDRLSSLDDRIIHLDPEVLLDFDIDYSWRQGHLIEKLIKSIQRTKMDIQRVTNLAREHRTPAEEQRHNSLPSDFGFCRVGERADPIHDSREHVAKACLRCCQSEKRNWAVYHEPWNNGTLQVMNDMVVVVAPDASKPFGEQAEDNYNVCLFLLAAQEGASGSGKTLIEDTLRDMIAADQMYHSIRSPRRGSSTPFDELNWPYVMWNLPMPYRQNFPWETGDVRDWLTEHMEGRRIPSTFEWDRVRKLSLRKLYQGVLLDGKTHDEVLKDILTNEEVPQHQGTVAGKVESPTRDAPPSSSQTRTHLKRSDTCEGQQCSASTSTCHHLPLSQRSSDGTHSKKPHPQKTNLELELRQTPDAGTGGPVKSSAEENDTPIFCIPSSSPIAQSLPEFIDLTSDQEG